MRILGKNTIKVLLYFSNRTLKVLDEHLKKTDNYGNHRYTRGYYTGVTIPYIYEFVLNKKVKLSEIILILRRLKHLKLIRSLYCGHVSDMVIEGKFFSGHGNDSITEFNQLIKDKREEWKAEVDLMKES